MHVKHGELNTKPDQSKDVPVALKKTVPVQPNFLVNNTVDAFVFFFLRNALNAFVLRKRSFLLGPRNKLVHPKLPLARFFKEIGLGSSQATAHGHHWSFWAS